LWANLKEKDYLEGNVIKMDRKEIVLENVDWINLAQDKEKMRAVVNTVMNLRVL
jgi:hypothetical protein